MKKLYAAFSVVFLGLLVMGLELAEAVSARTLSGGAPLVAVPMPALSAPQAVTVPTSAALASPSTNDQAALAAYVETAMRAWSKETDKSASYDDVARDIAEVSLSEDPAYDDDENRGRTAVLLTTLAYFEGARFARYVDDGSCNDKKWRKSKAGYDMVLARADCDAGWAVSLWQVHAATFYFGNGKYQSVSMDELKDRETAIRVALRIVRKSLAEHAGLCEYSGEYGPCPKANLRLHFAERYSAKHPFAGATAPPAPLP